MAERDTYWMHVIDTNPVRMVALFHSIWARNRFAPRSRFGDGPESFATAVGTVLEVADDPSRTMWDKLVENGITEEICACIRTAHKINIVSERNQRYTDLFDKVSPFIIFVEILVNAGHHIQSPESRTNGHVLSVIKENWSKLVRKMWDDRQLMLIPSRHDERMVVMRLMAAFLNDADSFTPILNSQDDFTIPLITRCMLIEPHSGVFIIAVFAFTLILRPEDCGPLPKDLHARMLKGTPKGSFTRFFEQYTRNLRSCTAFELYGGIHMLEFLCYRSSRECDPEAKFLDALFHSHSLLSWFIDIVKSPDTATPTLGDEMSSVIQTSLAVITYCLRHIIVEGLGDTGTDFLRFMGRADLFGALENLLVTKGETVRDASGAVTALLLDIWRIVDLYPSTLCILRRNFPRPRLLRACLDIAFTLYPIRKGFIKIDLANEQSLQTLWIFLDHLEKMSLMSHRCMRRGCNARRTARCKLCYVVEYCGRQCQILDWPEHRVICGFKNNMVPTEAALLPPERLPFRLGEVIPWSSELPTSSIGDSPEHDNPQVEAE